MYRIIKNFLNNGGKCLLIEDGKPIGVVLTVEEYEKLLIPGINSNEKPAEVETVESNPIEIADIETADDVTLKDLGLDELPY